MRMQFGTLWLMRHIGTYLPLNSIDIRPNNVFPAQQLGDHYPEFCQQTYGVTPMSQEEIWSRYRISPSDILNSTQIIYSVAQYDPTTAVAPPYLPLTSNRCQSRFLYSSGMAHREDLFYPDQTDLFTVASVSNTDGVVLRYMLISDE